MTKQTTLVDYQSRVMRVVDYIWKNIERDVDVNTLAAVAHFSPYHFHRVYREMLHETVASTVRRLRLHHAACQLIRSEDRVQKIAKRLNYGSAEAFTRAFSKAYDQTPAQYRAAKKTAVNPYSELPEKKDYAMTHQVSIKQIDSIQLGGLPHVGDYNEVGAVFDKVFVAAQAHQLFGPNTRSIGIYYDDPASKSLDELRSHACISASAEQAKKAGLESLEVGGGAHACLQFKGPYSELEEVYAWYYGEWLPNSGYELADAPPFEEYVNNPKDVPPHELLTNIYLPIKS